MFWIENKKWKKFFKKDWLVVIFLLGFSFLLLLSPVYSEEERPHVCPTIVHINQYLKIPFGCDSTEFLQLSRYPERLPFGSVYQSRPLYIILASLLGLPLLLLYKVGWLNGVLNFFGIEEWIGRISDTSLGVDVFLFIIPYLFLNFLLLGLAIFLFKKIVSPKQWNAPVFLFSLVLVINIITKKSLFSVHSQMFNIVLALFVLFFSIKYLQLKKLENKVFYYAALVSGFLLPLYGSFVVIPFVFFSLYLHKDRLKEFQSNFFLTVRKFVVASLLFVFPYLSWISFSILVSGQYRNYEAETYRQFVWMADAWHGGMSVLFVRLTEFFLDYFSITLATLWPFLIMTVFSVSLYIWQGKKQSLQLDKKEKQIFFSSGIIFFWLFWFFYVMGYYEDRLSFNLVPLLLVLNVILFQKMLKSGKRGLRILLNSLAFWFVVAWCFYFINIPV